MIIKHISKDPLVELFVLERELNKKNCLLLKSRKLLRNMFSFVIKKAKSVQYVYFYEDKNKILTFLIYVQMDAFKEILIVAVCKWQKY